MVGKASRNLFDLLNLLQKGKGEAANGSLSLPHRNDYHYFRCIFYFLEVPKQIEAAVQAVCFSYLTINPVSSEKLKHYLESNRITDQEFSELLRELD